MQDIFNGKNDIALSTNKLFETGFYLLNLGFALVIMEITDEIFDSRTMLEILSTKIGGLLLAEPRVCYHIHPVLENNLYLDGSDNKYLYHDWQNHVHSGSNTFFQYGYPSFY